MTSGPRLGAGAWLGGGGVAVAAMLGVALAVWRPWDDRIPLLPVLVARDAGVGAQRPAAAGPNAATSAPAPVDTPGCPDGMLRVPGGTFLIGSPNGVGGAGEHPQTRVTLRPYCLDRTEVTVHAYARCVSAGRCTAAGTDESCNAGVASQATHPINCVDWMQADSFCRWRRARLPTEAEWELAARGPDERPEGRTYPWGDSAPGSTLLNACGAECTRVDPMYRESDRWRTTAPVGVFPAGRGPYGHLDLAGNVSEWTADWYELYPGGSIASPRGPDRGRIRVVRGGGFVEHRAAGVRGVERLGDVPTLRDSWVGFRCALGSREGP